MLGNLHASATCISMYSLRQCSMRCGYTYATHMLVGHKCKNNMAQEVKLQSWSPIWFSELHLLNV